MSNSMESYKQQIADLSAENDNLRNQNLKWRETQTELYRKIFGLYNDERTKRLALEADYKNLNQMFEELKVTSLNATKVCKTLYDESGTQFRRKKNCKNA